MKYAALVLLAVSSVIHLYHSWIDDYEKRRYTKPLLLIFIILYYLFSVDNYSFLLIAALITSWLGDVLLIPKGDKWFVMGGISFMATHVLLVLVYAFNFEFSRVIWPMIIPLALMYYGISAVIIHTLKPSTPKKMLLPMYFYLLCNSTMNLFALMQITSLRSKGAAVAYIGAVLFFVSDCTLFLVRYHKNKNLIFKKHFTVMLTYILGEFLITQGVIMLAG